MLCTSNVGDKRVAAVVLLVPRHVVGCPGTAGAEHLVLFYPHNKWYPAKHFGTVNSSKAPQLPSAVEAAAHIPGLQGTVWTIDTRQNLDACPRCGGTMSVWIEVAEED